VARDRGESWKQAAACRGADPDIFYPVVPDDVTEAMAFCSTCPVRNDCLDYALTNREDQGIWGGTTGDQRRRIRREMARAS
jgi:WhiB family redox-sensing transcriptional regulator